MTTSPDPTTCGMCGDPAWYNGYSETGTVWNCANGHETWIYDLPERFGGPDVSVALAGHTAALDHITGTPAGGA